MHAEAWSSIMGIWTQWMDALVAHPHMQNWCGHESDIDLIDFWCTKGGRAGVVCPESVFGIGGTVATSLIEAGLRNRISNRLMIGGGSRQAWEAAGEKDVLITIDEADGILNPSHKQSVTSLRTLGGHFLISIQGDAQLDVGLGSERTPTRFGTTACSRSHSSATRILRSGPATLQALASAGSRMTRTWCRPPSSR